jgi:hypothetical protein
MTDRRDPLERTDDKTTEDAGQHLTDPRETAHPPPGMTRRSRTSKTSRPAGTPIRAENSTYSSRTVYGPCSSRDAIRRRAGLAWSDARLDRRTTATASTVHIENVPQAGAATFGCGQQCALNVGLVIPIRVSVEGSSPSCARTTWDAARAARVTRSLPTDQSAPRDLPCACEGTCG